MDISKTGMSVQTEKPFEMGQAITVRFFINSKQDELVLSGKMVRKEGRGRSQNYGVHFDPLSLERNRRFPASSIRKGAKREQEFLAGAKLAKRESILFFVLFVTLW